MPLTDTQPPQFMDIRSYTSTPFDCQTHGQVNMVLQFNQDPARVFCADCLEAAFLGIAKKASRRSNT